jgi:SAM-dependent methyltransferase
MKFPESTLAHYWIDPLDKPANLGIEIGGSAHNPFTFKTKLNVDYSDSLDTIYKQEEIKLCGEALPVNIVAFGDELPFTDGQLSYVINSHLFEHLPNPIRALLEWWRILKPGGIIYSVVPFRDAAPQDVKRSVTTLGHLVADYFYGRDYETHPVAEGYDKYGHYHVYTLDSYLRLIDLVNEIPDSSMFEVVDMLKTCDKVPNGFVVVLKAIK